MTSSFTSYHHYNDTGSAIEWEESLSLPEFDPSCMTLGDYFKKGMGNPPKKASEKKNCGRNLAKEESS